MNSINVRGVMIGEGMPKICVPIVASSMEEIIEKARDIKNTLADIVEWRADYFADVFNASKVEEVLRKLRDILRDTPILFTFRTLKEGGEREIEISEYVKLNKMVIDAGFADMIDVEMFMDEQAVKKLVKYALKKEIVVVGSNHDFDKTPAEGEILMRFQKMQELKASILKIAVMPQSEDDVNTLMQATMTMASKYAKCPIVAMSMGERGRITRVKGEIFGSAMTFGMLGEASAPGQIPVNELRKELEDIHNN